MGPSLAQHVAAHHLVGLLKMPDVSHAPSPHEAQVSLVGLRQPPWRAGGQRKRPRGDATLALTIAVNGWIKQSDDFTFPWRRLPSSGRELWGLVWEGDVLHAAPSMCQHPMRTLPVPWYPGTHLGQLPPSPAPPPSPA
eukprot:XP_001691941.1 predicted protein [Chlamydomonas reinhardtii]